MEMKLYSPFNFGYGSAAPENIQDYLGRRAVIHHKLYTVAKVEPSQQSIHFFTGEEIPGAARLFVVTENTEDGKPLGTWMEAAMLAEPGKTVSHWHYDTKFRARPDVCERLYREGLENAMRQQDEKRAQERARQERREKRRRLFNLVKPEWAKAYIVAELHEDESDLMTDYHGHKITREVLLGFSKTTRNSFPELRKTVVHFQEAAHLAGPEAEEHRESYSGGHGYYLCEKNGSWHSGWVVKKTPIWNDGYAPDAELEFYILKEKIMVLLDELK